MTHKRQRGCIVRHFLNSVGCLCVVGGMWAQPYSAGLEDSANPYDAPVPGFVGEARVNPVFLAWADTVEDYSPATDAEGGAVVDAFWQFSGEALGPVTGDNFAVVSLGDLSGAAIASGRSPGSLTVSFTEPIRNFSGADFAVFENGFIANSDQGGAGIGGISAELAHVEVSSNGEDFARFESVSLTGEAVGPYGSIDPTQVFNLAGKHVNAGGESWGTPFDLEDLSDHSLVQSGAVDLNAITHLRLVDVPGSGDFPDSRGNPIYDAWYTFGSGGADIEAVGAIGQPQSYAEWAEIWEVADEGTDADDDGDGYTNFAEYALALDPGRSDGSGVPRLVVGANGAIWFVFSRDERNADARIIVESQNRLDPEGWREVARFDPFAPGQLTGDGIAQIEEKSIGPQASVGVLREVWLRLSDLDADERSRFLRLQIESADI